MRAAALRHRIYFFQPYRLYFSQEYFEKKRYQNKVKRFEKPSSPRKRKLKLSTDLLSLQAATFSAKKFSTTGKCIEQGETTRKF